MDGYQPLIAEIREIVGRIAVSYKDERLAEWALSGPIEVVEDGNDVRFSSGSIPTGRLPSPEPDSDLPIWTIDRAVLVELALRTASARAKRWLVDEQRLLPMPESWRAVLRSTAQERFKCETSIGAGWVDLLLAVDDWLVEIGQPATWGQIKEKYAGIRLYADNSFDEPGNDIIDHAENGYSQNVCETCGAPGRTRDRSGWSYTSCDEHVK